MINITIVYDNIARAYLKHNVLLRFAVSGGVFCRILYGPLQPAW